jgi:hypothetical protein
MNEYIPYTISECQNLKLGTSGTRTYYEYVINTHPGKCVEVQNVLPNVFSFLLEFQKRFSKLEANFGAYVRA